MKLRSPVIIIDKDFRSENISGSNIRALAQAIEQEGMGVTGLISYDDLTSFVQQSGRASTSIVSIDDDEFINPNNDKPESEAVENLRAFVAGARRRDADTPTFLYGETHTSRHLLSDALREPHGFIHMFEDTSEFVAQHIIHEAYNYLDSPPPPFFKVLIDYVQGNSYLWYCPGHSGGVTFLKSPVGQVFHQFSGKDILCTDVYNAVEELGQLSDYTGPVTAPECNAARISGLDHMSFVTDGTSTSNKMAWHANVTPGDIVVTDRNYHKSNLYAIMMTGATPVFLMPTRNHFGIVGPIPKSELEPETIARKITDHPFASKTKDKKPRTLTIMQGTYDGVLCSAKMIKNTLSAEIDTLHFDEVWLPHVPFHPFCENMHTIGHGHPRSKGALVYATQSTHKLLVDSSQTSQILVQDSETRKLDTYRFNKAYLMHMSASPQYSIITSRDVATATMGAPDGTVLAEESIAEALNSHYVMHKIEHEYLGTNGGNGRGDDQWFRVWGPDGLSNEGIEEYEAWILKANERQHGFDNLAEDFNLLDPIKAAIIIPGLGVDGKLSDSGTPAVIVTCYLAEHGTVVEKMSLYSFFVMFTVDIAKDHWNSLVTELQWFKDDHDSNQSLWHMLPEFVRQYPRYERIDLRGLCDNIHSVYQVNGVARVVTEMYLSDMESVMIPLDARAKMVHHEAERVAIGDLEGRVTGILLTPYPPGIPLLIPGERFNKTIVQYLQSTHEFNKLLPGFETDAYGLVEEEVDGRMGYFIGRVR